MAASNSRPKRARTISSHKSRTSQSIPKTEITINVYDLLPPGRLSNFLWTIGSALLHSGVVINNREYAYGGHARRHVTGVYSTRPALEPPGGTFRCGVLHGFTFRNEKEIEAILKEVADEFQGPRYNLLTNNCNHFTSTLCARLTGKAAPAWLNRAASIGVALPCVVPKEWVTPPDHETAEGELLDEEEDDGIETEEDERTGMLRRERQKQHEQTRGKSWRRRSSSSSDRGESRVSYESSARSLAGGRRIYDPEQTPPPRLVDTSGREMPVAERAPLPRKQ